MNSNFRDKMYNLETAPPSVVWDKIAEELTTIEKFKNLSGKLDLAESTPPEQIWATISARLADDSITAKMLQLEAIPPESSWERIKEELDKETPVVKKPMLIPLIRYAAAAVVIGIIAFGAIRLFTSTNETPAVAGKQSIPSVLDNESLTKINENNPKQLNQPLATIDEARDEAALEASKKTYAKLDLPKKLQSRDISNFYFASTNSDEKNKAALNELETNYENGQSTDRYITLMTPQGNIIRMSKKFSDMVCCISGDEMDPQCKDQLKKWREKIVSSSLGHSSENFMDILNLVNALQENDYN